MSRRYDILMVTDCRLPGGTSASVAEEITAQAAAGFTTGLLHVDSSLVRRHLGFNPRLRRCLAEGLADLVLGDAEIETDAVILRHPTVAGQVDPGRLPRVQAANRLLIANQAPGTPEGGELVHYDPSAVDRHVTEWLGAAATWAPIGPLVRDNLARLAPHLEQTEQDWVNIIDVDVWRTHRQGPLHRLPVLGRHSRNHPLKWPATIDDLLAVYPDHGVEVHVLGGADEPRRMLGGRLPANWVVHEFGEMAPEQFLAGVDYYVYYHHPDLVEAFGRTILEALASGAPAILPHHFERLFGDHCTYAPVEQVQATIRSLHDDPATYRERSERGVAFVEDNFGHGAHRKRVAELAQPTAAPRSTSARPAGCGADERTRMLLVSSNGVGTGHLMRLMSIARRAPDHVDPIFLTLSQGASVVEDAGYYVEYFASRPYSKAPSAPWHALLRDRLGEIIERYGVRAMAFDGTWPYRGFLEAADDHPQVQLVWSRRGMWKPGVTNEVLEEESDRFDLILEPGEFAADLDRGATASRRGEATQVGPITFLGLDELLPRDEARAELGLDPDRPAALVTLGAGVINDVGSLVGRVVDRLAAEADLQVCVTRSIISEQDPDVPDNVRTISVYPLARYMRAFDFAFAASGYNSYHELVLAAVPTAFVPNLETATDDQAARARFAEQVGIGLDLADPTPEEIDRAARVLLDEQRRSRMHERAVVRRETDGGGAAMEAILRAIEGPHGDRPPPAEAERRRLQIGEEHRLARLAARADAEKAADAPTAAAGAPSGATAGPTPGSTTGTATAGGNATPASAARPTTATPKRATANRAATTSARLRKKAKARAVRAAKDPRVQAVGRTPYLLLPETTRARIRRRLKRWDAPQRPRAPEPARLPVPAGTLLPEEHRKGLAPALFLLPPDADSGQVSDMVDAVARLQFTYRSFAPMFLTHDIDFRPFRRYGFLFEHLPSPASWERVESADEFAPARRDRIEEIIAWYRPVVTLALGPEQADDILRSEVAAIVGGLLA